MDFKVIIMAAGKGTRMKSNIPKVMHEIMGKPMIQYVIDVAGKLTDKKPIVIVGHKSEIVKDYLQDKVEYVLQNEQLGTGHAIKLAKDHIQDNEMVVVLSGDTPLIKADTLNNIKESIENGTSAVILSSKVENPFGYGRIIRNENNEFEKIVEQKDTDEKENLVKEINSGIYFFKGSDLRKHIDEINNNNAQNEYYLTDIFEIFKKNNYNIQVVNIDFSETYGVNSRIHLEHARKVIQNRINEKHMIQGVTLINPESIYIDDTVKIGQDTVIYPNCTIKGNTEIGNNCIIQNDSFIINSNINDEVTIIKSYIEDSSVDKLTTIGPYSHLRPKSTIGKEVKIGNFVEVKGSSIGDNSKASHLAYVGDAQIGKHVNVGCGVIFVNYDGKNKRKSIVKDHAFIGSNSNVVAPVELEEKAYVATGSTVTDNVPKDSLCIARSRQVIKIDWTKNKKLLD